MSWFSRKSPELPPLPEKPKGKEITDKEAAEFSHDENFEGAFVGNTDREKRDAEGKLLVADTVIISNPENPGALMEDSPELRRAFIQHGFSFKFKKEPFAPPEERANALVEGEVKDYFTEAVKKAADFKEKVDAIKPVTLTGEKRDAEGKLLGEGQGVIIDPVYEELVMEDTPENRATFIKNGGTWKPEK